MSSIKTLQKKALASYFEANKLIIELVADLDNKCGEYSAEKIGEIQSVMILEIVNNLYGFNDCVNNWDSKIFPLGNTNKTGLETVMWFFSSFADDYIEAKTDGEKLNAIESLDYELSSFLGVIITVN